MKERCSKCHSGNMQLTANPRMLKCDFCGRTRSELTLKEYMKSLKEHL